MPSFIPLTTINSYAEDGEWMQRVYVYDDNGNCLLEKSNVEVGDRFLSEDFCLWEIYSIQENIAFAKKVAQETKPYVKIKNSTTKPIDEKNICMYMTHNDESYLPTDGYDSIYGKGGIHDVASTLKSALEKLGINVTLDQTLHIPHDSKAYTRSKVTATSLQNSKQPSGLFDIHRDGVAKNVYLSQNENGPLSKIRIVVGKGNPNFEKNYEFAKEIFSLGQALYPWLFLDIYCGKGTYNQNLQEHALLFEMGTYLIEKEYVFSSTPYLANVINTALFKSVQDDNGDIFVDEQQINALEDDYENHNNLSKNNENEQKLGKNSQNFGIFAAILIISASATALSITAILLLNKKKNRPL